MLNKIKENPHKYFLKVTIVLLVVSAVVNAIQLVLYMPRGLQDLLKLLAIVLFGVYMKGYRTRISSNKSVLALTFVSMAIYALFTLFLSYDCFADFKYCKISRVIACIITIYPVKEMTEYIFSRWIYQLEYFPWLIQSIITVLWHIVIMLFFIFVAKPKITIKEQLTKLKAQYEAGTITEEIYNQKREEILKKL